ncbi:2-oxoglutarate (2OG) and Fe(II)-dependent oxygenase superfamily protein [Raphanus sativus]|uniref:2-oxoglutarate-Fe(II) type oxidoreductase hxnY-like isoform X2 n=1 Tax=Raphanus sativus TaxID=3726 RepID=A0A9W3D9Q3_RAPSA|nr:2-oxoglutarate-Fe(II) type oxidoreductase hxnY-like isoform X2 [Raphanus sativus]KAJ4907534.1 2-oxoglutarate (2OG) and Fe(II)-dependent oxygenase superfamily protein [Raphanus sativus]
MESKTQEEASIIKVSSLHCIDLANSDLRQLAVSLKQACLDCGFFYVINHGISEELKDEVFKQSKKLFALPLEEKMKLLRNEKYRGYAPLHDQLFDPDNQVWGDCKEGYSIGVLRPKDDSHDNPFYSPNIWPDPDVLPGWRATMETFYQEALRVCKAIASIMALALDLDVNYFDKPNILGNHNAVMRLLHYEGHSDPSKGIYASGAHSDYGMMTLLANDSVMGLQICKDKDVKPRKWEYVPSIKGAYIVNIGDLLERWSNCLLKSTLHRVIGNGHERYSVPFFLEPSHECIVECLPTCQSQNNLPKYPAIKCSTYLTQRYKEAHADLSIYEK